MKKFLVLLLTMFLIAQTPTDATESKNLLGLTKLTFKQNFVEKFGRVPDVKFFWKEDGFCGNADAELWLDMMVSTLEAIPAEQSPEFFLFTREAFFIYGIVFTVALSHI